VIKNGTFQKLGEKEIVEFYKTYIPAEIGSFENIFYNGYHSMPPPPPPPGLTNNNIISNNENKKSSIIILKDTLEALDYEPVFKQRRRFKNAKKIVKIFDDKLTEIPFELFDTLGVEILSIGSSNLTYISDKLFQLNRLVSLDIRCSKCTSLADSFQNLPNIDRMQLRLINVGKLPESIGKLENLTELTLRVKDDAIPTSISNLKSLKTLSLYADSLSYLNEAVSKIPILENLLLYSTIKESQPINEVIINGEFKSLKHLLIENITIPSIQNFPNLNILKAQNCEMQNDFFHKNIKLKNVSIRDQEVQNIPDSLFDLPYLEQLSIMLNDVEQYPSIDDFLKLSRLKSLYFLVHSRNLLEQKKNLRTELNKIKNLKFEIY
ncbi:MAG: hypothetical protein SFU99_22390, partial [Saprospiraceae bacterium]|nr:hypothetical protein [Saprospiraceae bacterium]